MSAMTRDRLRILTVMKPWTSDIELLICTDTAYVKEMIFEERKEGYVMEPQGTCSISRQTAQDLMDQLWMCGLRPTEGAGSAGALAATERHLRDMQRLVFHKLENPTPQNPPSV